MLLVLAKLLFSFLLLTFFIYGLSESADVNDLLMGPDKALRKKFMHAAKKSFWLGFAFVSLILCVLMAASILQTFVRFV